MCKKKHSIVYDNAPSDWNEALPLGNGVFGGMTYFKDQVFRLALNHYEVYYTHLSRYSKAYQEKLANGSISFKSDSYSYQDCFDTAKSNYRDYEQEGYIHYRKTIWPTADLTKDISLHRGESHPPTGEISLQLGEAMSTPSDYSHTLYIEEGRTCSSATALTNTVTIKTVILKDIDASLIRVSQINSGGVQRLSFTYPEVRNRDGVEYSFSSENDNSFSYEVSFYPEGENRESYPPFRFIVHSRLVGAKGRAKVEGNTLAVDIYDDKNDYFLITHVLTELQSNELSKDAKNNVEACIKNIASHEQVRNNYWENFFARSCISLPDLYLERLWYLNLYVLDCSSGKGGKRFEQASGLNGLWDIKQPTIWGSRWYWDVNIQATYWPVYTANHLELAEVFNDGFLSYSDMAKKRAEEYYGMSGYAIDYPHTFYNCMWPWCAQFLWWYYEYTLDKSFLREKAYPMFKNQILFIKDLVKINPDTGKYSIFPDVSPEQGPITRDSTITISTVKYLLEIAIKTNRLLDSSKEDEELFKGLLSRLPSYSVEKIDRYGEIIKDSASAPPNLRLRHPSLLMPIFPISEFSMYSDKGWRDIAENTVRFASENSEIGVFPFGWISAAAARLGKGSMALRILYEQGIDLLTRANGMGAEETDRWINLCNIANGQLYYPFMMECTGEVISCVNEMLLQSFDGVITVFPAIPNGDEESWRMIRQQIPHRLTRTAQPPPIWQECRFDRLLAKSGFEVSAVLTKGKTATVTIKSLLGEAARIRLPIGIKRDGFKLVDEAGNLIDYKLDAEIISFETNAGKTYRLLNKEQTDIKPTSLSRVAAFCYPSHLGRWVFAGKDRNTDTIKRLDSFLHDYYIANDRYNIMTPYKFSFGVAKKDLISPVFSSCYEPQDSVEHFFHKITPDMAYCRNIGFGFEGDDFIRSFDSGHTNVLLQDYVSGENPASFCIELPKGRYELLAVTGSATEPFCTCLSVNGSSGRVIETAIGQYSAVVLPVEQDGDKDVALQITSAKAEKPWNLNLLIVKKIQAYL